MSVVNPENFFASKRGKKAFGGVMQTFDNTRPMVAAQGLGVARAALDLTLELLREKGIELDFEKGYHQMSAVESDLYDLEAEYETARLLVLKAAWMADNKQPNSMKVEPTRHFPHKGFEIGRRFNVNRNDVVIVHCLAVLGKEIPDSRVSLHKVGLHMVDDDA